MAQLLYALCYIHQLASFVPGELFIIQTFTIIPYYGVTIHGLYGSSTLQSCSLTKRMFSLLNRSMNVYEKVTFQ